MVARRTAESRAVDLLLELAALERVAREGPARIGATVFQKIFFWTEMRLRERASAAPHLTFFRHHHGPFSEDLAEDVKLLRRLGHLERANFRLSPRGLQIARHWRTLLEPTNAEVFATIDAAADELAGLTAEQVKRRTYALSAEQVGAASRYGTLADVPKSVALLLRRARPLRPFAIGAEAAGELIMDLKITATEIASSKRPAVAVNSADELEAALGESEP